MCKLGYLQISSRIPKNWGFSTDQWCGTRQWTVQEAFKPTTDFKESWKGYMLLWVTGCQIHLSVSGWLHFHTWTIWYQYLYTKNHKAVNTYHHVFCYPESVNTKWENLIVYDARLYRVLWEMDTLPPFFYYELLLTQIGTMFQNSILVYWISVPFLRLWYA